MLYEHIEKLDFETVIRLCRFVNEATLWATLAAMSIYARELNTVEIALAQIDEADKVQYIDHIQQKLTSEPARQAAMLVYQKRIPEAETILLQARLFYRAIKLNIRLYRWDRAMDIAVQNKTHVDTVIAYRQRFLQQYGREENNERMKQYARDIEVDWETVKTKITADKEKERQSAEQQN
jgi:intraflagellar transport protein 80